MANAVSRQQVIEVAGRLFGEVGYDGTSLRLIADAMGTTPAAIVEVAGDKRAIYLKVMDRAAEAERAMLESVVSQAEPGLDAVHQIVDTYLDFYLEHPRNRALWAHRWVDDAADIPDVEDRYARPLLHLAAPKFRGVVPPDVDPYFVLGTIIWCVHGFLGSGILDRAQGVRRADDPKAVASFRRHLHILVDRLLTPP
ncbi:TetR/AcrR family transcriptional regulator [Actinomadura chokoriensis]|uniref:TetR/AcrR family transcriptional regulator n=1 Tax=Actinomadura chokoriensis TaxID=454156 RepID=A0ABV4R766_9ACTN